MKDEKWRTSLLSVNEIGKFSWELEILEVVFYNITGYLVLDFIQNFQRHKSENWLLWNPLMNIITGFFGVLKTTALLPKV